MDDNLMVAKWKIEGVKRILQALQTVETSNFVDENVFFVLSSSLVDALELLDGIS